MQYVVLIMLILDLRDGNILFYKYYEVILTH